MKGSNEIRLNQKTMLDVVQHYFKTVMFRRGRVPKVVGINMPPNQNFFVIDVTDEEAAND